MRFQEREPKHIRLVPVSIRPVSIRSVSVRCSSRFGLFRFVMSQFVASWLAAFRSVLSRCVLPLFGIFPWRFVPLPNWIATFGGSWEGQQSDLFRRLR